MSTFYKAVTSSDRRYFERHPPTEPHSGVDLSFVTQAGVAVHSGSVLESRQQRGIRGICRSTLVCGGVAIQPTMGRRVIS